MITRFAHIHPECSTAFSVAINVDADILMIDEILAVGDAAFQAKCFNRLQRIKAEGTTIVIVSHSLGQIEQICDRSIWIYNGIIREEGEPRRVHMDYLDYMGQKQQEVAKKEQNRQEQKSKEELPKKRWGNGDARIHKVTMLDKSGNEKMIFATGEPVRIRIDYKVREKIVNAVVGIGIFRMDGVQCYGTNTRVDKLDEYDLVYSGTVVCDISRLNLISGKYALDVAIECGNGIPVDYFREICTFEMYSPIPDVGVARMDHKWLFEEREQIDE